MANETQERKTGRQLILKGQTGVVYVRGRLDASQQQLQEAIEAGEWEPYVGNPKIREKIRKLAQETQ